MIDRHRIMMGQARPLDAADVGRLCQRGHRVRARYTVFVRIFCRRRGYPVFCHGADSRAADRLDQAVVPGRPCAAGDHHRAGPTFLRRTACGRSPLVRCTAACRDGDVLFSGLVDHRASRTGRTCRSTIRPAIWRGFSPSLTRTTVTRLLSCVWSHAGQPFGRSDHAARQPVAADGTGGRFHQRVESRPIASRFMQFKAQVERLAHQLGMHHREEPQARARSTSGRAEGRQPSAEHHHRGHVAGRIGTSQAGGGAAE